MSFFISIFNEILIRPLFNVLIIFHNLVGDFGLAIILLTILVRLVLHPLSAKAVRSQKELTKIQPQIQEIQKKHKGNQSAQAKELMKLYQEHNINPFSGCLPILIQIPILIAMYRVFLDGLDPSQLANLYYFVQAPESINPIFIGFLDLSQRSILLALITGFLQFWQSKISLPAKSQIGQGSPTSAMMGKQLLYILPVITVVIAVSLPAGPVLYWFTATLIGIIQQIYIKPRQIKTLANHDPGT